jgi:hypothetical protein
MPITRRDMLLFGGSGLLVSGCSALSQYSTIGQSFSAVLKGDEGYPLSAQQVASSPYAQLGVQFGNGPRAIMILGEVKADRNVWVATNNVIFTVQAGRIVQTMGLAVDLVKSRVKKNKNPDPLRRYQSEDGKWIGSPHQREVSFEPLGPKEALAESHFTLVGHEAVQILDKPIRCLKVTENYRIPALVWTVTNEYWLGVDTQTPVVWKSRQHIHPDLPPVNLEILKRPA